MSAGPFFAVPEIYLAGCLRRSAQRRFMASAMALRPSGLSFRLLVLVAVFVAGAGAAAETAFLLPLGRPRRPLLTTAAAPLSSVLACCSFAISASICAITSVIANRLPPMFSDDPKRKAHQTVRATNTNNHTELASYLQIFSSFFL